MTVWEKLSLEQMRDEQKKCPVIGKLWKQMVGHIGRKEIREYLQSVEYRRLWRIRRALIMRNGVIYWKGFGSERQKWKPLLPVSCREEALQAAHEQWGHQGVTRTTALLKGRCFWPGLYEDVKKHVSRCKTCAVGKEEGVRSKT